MIHLAQIAGIAMFALATSLWMSAVLESVTAPRWTLAHVGQE